MPETPPPSLSVVAKRLTHDEFAQRDRDNASDICGDGKKTRLRILAILTQERDRRNALPEGSMIIEDAFAVREIEAGLRARLETIHARLRQAA